MLKKKDIKSAGIARKKKLDLILKEKKLWLLA